MWRTATRCARAGMRAAGALVAVGGWARPSLLQLLANLRRAPPPPPPTPLPRRQQQHFDLVFAAARRAGWLGSPEAPAAKIDHVGFGLVMGEDGKKFKWVPALLLRCCCVLTPLPAAITHRQGQPNGPPGLVLAQLTAVCSCLLGSWCSHSHDHSWLAESPPPPPNTRPQGCAPISHTGSAGKSGSARAPPK